MMHTSTKGTLRSATEEHQTYIIVKTRGGKSANAFIYCFLLALVLCLSPSKMIAYAAPLLFLCLYLVLTGDPIAIKRLIWIMIGGLTASIFYYALLPDFSFRNILLFALTSSSLLVAYCTPSALYRDNRLLETFSSIAAYVLILEGSIGIIQGMAGYLIIGNFDLDNGDRVQGTIYPFLEADRSFSNPMFSANMCLLLLALIASPKRTLPWRLAVSIGSISVLLASVMHQIIFALVAVVISAILVYRHSIAISKLLSGTAAVAAVTICIFVFLPQNISSISSITNQFARGQSPRSKILLRVWTSVPGAYFYQPFVGLGPGQFSSRAALIGTGLYFKAGADNYNSSQSDILQPFISPAMSEFLMDLWADSLSNPYYGSSEKPFFSALNIYTELGLAGVLAATLILFRVFRRFLNSRNNPSNRNINFSGLASVIFILLLGFQENYWEVPQAIFLGILSVRVLLGEAERKTRSIQIVA